MNRSQPHTCHARGCEVECPPHMFMCRSHWYSLTKDERAAIWAVYVPGQETRMDPTDMYLEVSQRVIDALAGREGIGR